MKLDGPVARRLRHFPSTVHSGSETWAVCYGIFGFLTPGLTSILIPLLVVHAGHRPFRVGSVVAAQNWGILLAPFWGWFAGRFRTTGTIFIVGLLCLGSGLGAFSMVHGLSALLFASFLIGIGAGACNTAASLLVVGTHPPSRSATSRSATAQWAGGLGHLQLYTAIGTVVGFGVATRMPASTAAMIGFVVVIPAIALGLRPSPPHPGAEPAKVVVRDRPFMAATGIDVCSMRRARSRFLLFLASWSLFSLSVSGFSSLFPITMLRAFGLHVRVSVDAIAVATVVGLPLYGMAARLIGRFGASRILAFGFFIRFGCLALLGILTALHASAEVLVLLLIGLFQGIWPLISVSSVELAVVLAPGLRGVAIGIFNATGALSSGAGAMLSGLAADLSGYRSISLWAAGVALVAFACSLVPALRGDA